MAAKEGSSVHARTAHLRTLSVLSMAGAAALFLVSAALQLAASLQRWVVFRGAGPHEEFRGEDHLYDYFFPLDPWQNVGWAAQAFGAGTLAQALGVALMAAAMLLMPAAPSGGRALGVEIAAAALVTASFGFIGTHALMSASTDTASPLQHFGAITWMPLAGLLVLGVRWLARAPAVAAACVFLLGSTVPGYLVAAFLIAPFAAGYISHDTTPWTETVMASTTAAAGISLLVAARAARRPGVAAARNSPAPDESGVPPTVTPR
ncbi:hypothetical protein JOF48_002228 [Arthrobacter stackebrandtii]|uniref:DUF998 domain-containing protein n=1 Tax=Arthrobacter stackebrandtii TaxID=272161 RepID=A0ABS4YXJ2_9MICC|nr:hypothetical protein [Arthrobacter stackebrandtii]MBP2413429.1 hypothetical protein [Arthrobacter stackebrandtii]PYH00721.1 hypothetical protein CVV67_09415 [Arthrobacter stackebrandtii]